MEMDSQNVLIPGAGGAAGICTIKSLRMWKAFNGKIIATDVNKLSAGLYLADKGYTVPPADDSLFIQETTRIIREENIGIILPTSGFDIVPYSKHKKNFGKKGITVAMSDHDTIRICLNKLKLYYKLKDEFNMPFTTTPDMWTSSFPCIVKPIHGKGSRDVFVCYNYSDIEKILFNHKNMLAQEYLPGTEYTVDVLSDLEGNSLVAIPRERIEIRSGVSYKGRIVPNKTIEEVCLRLTEFLGIKGPSCVQVKYSCNGIPKIVEINPRIGGGTILTTYAGVNIPELVVKLSRGERIEIPKVAKVTMLRYYNEVILSGEDEPVIV